MAQSQVEGWSDPEQVEEYLERVARLAPRLAGEAALAEALPATPRRVLDLGCGDGRVAALVLQARRGVREVVGVDRSAPMLARAAARFAGDDRVTLLDGDLDDSIERFGSFDLVVSGFAIHHAEDHRKQTLFAEIARSLYPGGVFANLEVVKSATPELHLAFRTAIGRTEDDPADRLADVESQLGWMRAAGLAQVDCLWRWRGFALLVGAAPS
jgi:tRNA (cmo5U34)-methyltransferase